jgi:hypothetical protein
MSREKFDPECKGCRPAIIDTKTMKEFPPDHPLQKAAMLLFNKRGLYL